MKSITYRQQTTASRAALALAVIAALAAQAACTNTPQEGDPHCVRTEVRKEGVAGVEREVCVEWVFGPTRTQREQFDRRSVR